MKKFKFIRHDEKAMELPINIVVMLVVGMVALATLISIMPTPTKDMWKMQGLEEAPLRKETQ